jgi:hypothetical protein
MNLATLRDFLRIPFFSQSLPFHLLPEIHLLRTTTASIGRRVSVSQDRDCCLASFIGSWELHDFLGFFQECLLHYFFEFDFVPGFQTVRPFWPFFF